MSYNELNKLSHEDLNIFEERLTAFFKTSVSESYNQLRRHLETRIPRSRFSDSNDLIDASITRLIAKVAEFERRGEHIADLNKFAARIASFIIREDSRRKDRQVDIEPDPSGDGESAFRRRELKYSPDPELSAIEREVKLDCMAACLEKLSREKQTLLLSYYPTEPVTAKEKKEIRQKLALSEARKTLGTSADASPHTVRNLQTQVSKTRSKLSECLSDCFEANTSRDPKMVFLQAQQVRT
ncbi:MAG TPA: hypothetical protein VJT15_03020 [Pyrinomonadaceae bacterium]|nr:hypothetical protein [Pyrinomonadaceae bacterium]